MRQRRVRSVAGGFVSAPALILLARSLARSLTSALLSVAGGFAPDALAAAVRLVHVHVHGGHGFVEMLRRSLEFAGPANFSPVIAGALGGALWGEDGVRSESERALKASRVSVDLCNSLVDRALLAQRWPSSASVVSGTVKL